MNFTKNKLISGLFTSSCLLAASTQAVTLGTFEDTTVTYGGYIKLDTLYSSYSDGDLDGGASGGNIGRDFYVPSLTPVGGNDQNSKWDMHARQSRFNLGTSSTVNGVALKTFFELDFFANGVGDERLTNAYAPVVRHAFLTYGNWVMGQTWSTFQNTNSLPESADFIGNTDGGIFIRQAQIRYTKGNWQFAVENPETTVTPLGGGARIVTDDNSVPDFVGRYNLTSGGLTMSFAVLARQLSYDDGAAIDSTTNSTSVSITGKMMLGQDDIRFGVNSGKGLGRYVGLNATNGAVIDTDGDLEAIDATGYFASYRHVWNPKWRSNFTYSALSVDNDVALTGASAIESTESYRVNLIYSATPKLSLGGELSYATKTLESDADGSMNRFQFFAKLDF